DQVVREAVEKICREFSGQCCIHKPVGAEAQVPEVTSSTLPGAPSPAPACSSCRGQTAGGGYQCSVCTSCTLCEPCSFSHDPSHNLVRARTPLSIPEHGSPAPDHSRWAFVLCFGMGDRSFRKAEKQRLKAEKRQLKAEVKEIRKQLRMERRGLQWSTAGEGSSSPVLLQPRAAQANSPDRPKRPCPLAVPAMTALLLDENLPDGSRLRPGTKFIKYWKMKNSGRVCWDSETKLKFMWGNLAVGSGERWREVAVPTLQPGQVGVISVALCAPTLEGTYTSHWRLAHRGEQFGPRVWCSIVVDPHAPTAICADGLLSSRTLEREEKCRASREQLLLSVNQDCDQEFYIPSVDLLTAQDLLSFELLDINIVQELESVPNNTPADVTPCISPLPHDGPLQEKPTLGLIQEETEAQGVNVAQGTELEGIPAQEKGEESIIGLQSLFSPSVIRSLTLEVTREVAEHGVLCGRCPGHESDIEQILVEPAGGDPVEEGEEEVDKKEQVNDTEAAKEIRSRTSSASSEDYIIILPDCFDTSRPLGESMYSSALSQPGEEPSEGDHLESVETADLQSPVAAAVAAVSADANDMLCASQTLDAVPLTPVIVVAPRPLVKSCITGGLVKGALSVAASAYKALFTGQTGSEKVTSHDAMMAVLVEMGFGDRALNQHLLQKHNRNLLDVVNELVQMTDNNWYTTRY
uniref:NBR1 autophagy cargo receptor b n=1 Tax=Cyprinus carpio TaxID=7962 RepID=A0A8C1NX73_CYPCA